MIEWIVYAPQPFAPQVGLAELLQEPHLLVVRDVAQVPHDRAHQRIVLAPEVVVREAVDQERGPGPRFRKQALDLERGEGTTDVKVHGGRWLWGVGPRKVGAADAWTKRPIVLSFHPFGVIRGSWRQIL